MPSAIAEQTRKRRRRALRNGVTQHAADFAWLVRNFERINIVTEGDSWFAYPRRHIFAGPNANIVDWIVDGLRNKGKSNLLRLASNGDEAVSMIAGAQKHALAEILKTNGNRIHLLLFSGGGNDVVGKWDMERLLVAWQEGFEAEDCIDMGRLRRKLQRVSLAYRELVELRNTYSPDTVILTHTYDYLTPSTSGASFLWGLVKTKPWIWPYMEEKGIPEPLRAPICAILLERLRDGLQAIARSTSARGRFVVVDTLGTLRPGHKSDWRNEIHPSSAGFKRIARKIHAEVRSRFPELPDF